ncbi:MAG: biopolymer transporter ExbD [Kiritimatiellales bacterium]|nr:biopolymer transporter ExbD [Kiritimatiellales bacterium]
MKLKLPVKSEVEVNMAPMIDMVFLLLIFFMVASVVKELDKKEDIEIPTAKYAKVPDDPKGRLMLQVDNQNKIYIGLQEVTLDELKALIDSELAANPDLRIQVRADELVHYKTTKDIMIVCAELGATDLIYSTFEE